MLQSDSKSELAKANAERIVESLYRHVDWAVEIEWRKNEGTIGTCPLTADFDTSTGSLTRSTTIKMVKAFGIYRKRTFFGWLVAMS